MSNVGNENGGAWTENWRQNLLGGWILQSLYHTDKIYIAAPASIIYYKHYKILYTTNTNIYI